MEHQQLEDAVKVAALRDAAEKGWSDLASGRYYDIADENLDDFIGQLGVRAARNEPAGDAASRIDDVGHTPRPELGDGVFSWHLAQSRTRARGKTVRRPRHFLICRREGDVLVIGRALHDAMELRRYPNSAGTNGSPV